MRKFFLEHAAGKFLLYSYMHVLIRNQASMVVTSEYLAHC